MPFGFLSEQAFSFAGPQQAAPRQRRGDVLAHCGLATSNYFASVTAMIAAGK
jgi:hypothetical protein